LLAPVLRFVFICLYIKQIVCHHSKAMQIR